MSAASNAEIKEAFEEAFGEEVAPAALALKDEMDALRFEQFKASISQLQASQNKVSELAQKVPKFWITSMLNSSELSVHIPKCDHEAIEHLKDVRIVHKSDPRNFDVVFTFAENPFFSNAILTKSFTVTPDDGEDAPAQFDLTADLYKIASEPINWKSGKNLLELSPKVNLEDLEEDPEREYDEEKGFGSFFHLFTESGQDEGSYGEALMEWRAHALEYFVEPDSDDDDEEWEDDDHVHGANCKHDDDAMET